MRDYYGGRQLGAETRGGAYPAFYFLCSLFGPIWPELRSKIARAGVAGHGPRESALSGAEAKRTEIPKDAEL